LRAVTLARICRGEREEIRASGRTMHSPIRTVHNMTAKELAEQATKLAEKLKPGTWEAVQALALASIAQSLATMSEHRDHA
jgi:hypothetical protein